MASWKKVIVSGSSANLTDLQVDSLSSGLVTGNSGNLTTTAVNGSGNIVATTAATGLSHSGSFSGSFQGDGSSLTGVVATNLDIDTFGDDLTGATLAGTDKLILSDGGTEGRVNVSQLSTPLAGTGLEANAGTVRIAAAAAGAGLTGGAGSALAVGAGTGITVNADDIQISDGGVTATQLATSVAGDGLAGGGGTALSVNVDDSTIEITTDTLNVKDSGITNAKLANSSVSIGDQTVTLGAAATTAFTGLTNVVSTKFSGSFSGSFEGDGSNLTGLATTLTIDADSGGTSTVDLQSQTLDIAGTTNEIVTSVSGQTITVALPDDVTIGQDLTVTRDAVITRNLTVQGTASFQATTDLDVADRFIRLASGSNAAGEGGFVVQQGSNGLGEVFGYDQSTLRFGVSSSFDATQNAFTPDAYFSNVIEGAADDPTATIAKYTKKGNTFVATNGDIYIYS